MKTSFLFAIGALAGSLFLTARASASPGGFSGRVTPYQDYVSDGISELHHDPVLFGGPRRLSFGIYAEIQRRRVETKQAPRQTFDWNADYVMGSLGYDILPNLTVIGAAGRSSLEIDDLDLGKGSIWLAGARMRLMDFFVFDPLNRDIFWCRLDSVVHYSEANTTHGEPDMEWSEWRAALTASVVARPHRLRYLDSVGAYVGPVYSKLRAYEDFGFRRERMDGKYEFGLVAGLFANPSRHTVLKVELERFERNGLNISAGFHF